MLNLNNYNKLLLACIYISSTVTTNNEDIQSLCTHDDGDDEVGFISVLKVT